MRGASVRSRTMSAATSPMQTSPAVSSQGPTTRSPNPPMDIAKTISGRGVHRASDVIESIVELGGFHCSSSSASATRTPAPVLDAALLCRALGAAERPCDLGDGQIRVERNTTADRWRTVKRISASRSASDVATTPAWSSAMTSSSPRLSARSRRIPSICIHRDDHDPTCRLGQRPYLRPSLQRAS